MPMGSIMWDDEIQPLLLKRFPGLSEEQMREAQPLEQPAGEPIGAALRGDVAGGDEPRQRHPDRPLGDSEHLPDSDEDADWKLRLTPTKPASRPG